MNLNQVLKRPIITEKALNQSALGRYLFEVDSRARHFDIRKAIKKAFNVDVVEVKVMRVKGKVRRFGRQKKRICLGDWKKAMVQLAPGQKIDIFTVPQEEEKPSSAKATEGKKEEKK
jgi:large subunit ribosomal protein L23